MAKTFLSKKIIIPAVIFLGGLLIAAGVLTFSEFSVYEPIVAAQFPEWTQEAGGGILIPACGSASASVTCSGSLPQATISWNDTEVHGGKCSSANVVLNYMVVNKEVLISGQPCSGSYTFTGLANNTTYSYDIFYYINVSNEEGRNQIVPLDSFRGGSFTTPNCTPPPGDFSLSLGGSVACNSVPLSWTASSGATAYRILKGSPRVDISPYQPYTALNFTDTTVSQNTTYPYQIEAYNSVGTNRSNTINVSTPYCPPTLNFSGSTTSIFQGQSVTLSWSSANATSCVASGSWSGSKPTSGSEIVFPSPPPSATFNLTCSGPGGSASVSVTVNITPLALPNWKEVIPR